MQYYHVSSHLDRVLTTVLQPRCALCDENHHLPDRLCPLCKISIASARLQTRVDELKTSKADAGQATGLSHKISSRTGESQRCGVSLGALDAITSVFSYQGAIPELITRWKYHRMIELTGYIADLVSDNRPALPHHDIVTVIPSHWQRRLLRGFEPVWLLANALTNEGVIDRPISLLKPHQALPYQHLKRFDQRHIVSSHFRVIKNVHEKRILILDDVVTSGSTLNAAAIALRKAGAKSVCGLTVASAASRSIAHA